MVTTAPADGSSARPAGVEVVAVVVVGEQHGVDRRPRSAAAIAGPVSLRDPVPQPKLYVRPGRVERRVGEQPPAADLDQDRRPADVRDPDVRSRSRVGAPLVVARAWLRAHSRA